MNVGELERLRGTLEELSLSRKQLPFRQQADKPILRYDTTLSKPVQLFNQGDALPRRDPHNNSHSTTSTTTTTSTSSSGSASTAGTSHPHHSSSHHSASHHSKVHHPSIHSGPTHHSSSHHSSSRHGPSHHALPRGQNQPLMASSVSNLSRPARGVSDPYDPYNRPVSAKEVLEKAQHNRQWQCRMQAHSTLSGGRSSAVIQDPGAAALQLNSFLRPHSGFYFPGKHSPPPHRKEMTTSRNGDTNAELSSTSQEKKVSEDTSCKRAASSTQSSKVRLQQAFVLAHTARDSGSGTSMAVSGPLSHSKDNAGSSTTGTGPSSRSKNTSGSSMAVTGLPPRPKDMNSNSTVVTGLPPRPKDSPSIQGKESSRTHTPVRKATVVKNPYYSSNQPYSDVNKLSTERKLFSADSSKQSAGQPRSVNTPPGESTQLQGRLLPPGTPLPTTSTRHGDPFYYSLSQETSSCKAGMEESGTPFHRPHPHSANASTTYASTTTRATTETNNNNSKVGTLRKMPVTNTLTGTLYYKKSFREATQLVEQKQKKGGSTGFTAATALEHRPIGDGAPSSKLSVGNGEEKVSRSSSSTTTTATTTATLVAEDDAEDEFEDEMSTPSGERLPGDGEASIDGLDDDDDGIDDIYGDFEVDSNDEDSDDFTISSNTMSQPSSASTLRLHPSVHLHSRAGKSPSRSQSRASSRAAGAGEEGTQSYVRPVATATSAEKVIQPALRQSLFPAIPPTINFVPEGEKVEQLPWNIRKLLKWRMSPITPNIVKSALGRINFRITKKNHDWLGCFGKHMKATAFKALREYQKLNHFPGSFQLGRKDRLWRNLSKLQVSFGKKEFDFFPQTYVLPQDLQLLKRAWEDSGPRQKWIIKPPASARGIGIKVINKWSQVPRKRPIIVQRYLARPLLINDRKFDMRVYVYVSSYDPLRAYVFEDGLARFASCKYSSSVKNLANKFVHLTNYSINKQNSQYQSNSDDNLCQGHKWSLKSLWNYLKKQGVNTQAVWDSIKDIVVKTLVCAEASINSMVKYNVRSRYVVHELFGFDILLDDMLRPWILEVNISPSLHSNSQLDINVKGQMIKDMMNLAGFRVPDKNDVHPSHASSSAVDLSAHVPSNDYCMDKRLFASQLAPDERAKHAHFCYKHQDEQVLQTILDTLTPDDVRMLTESIDEDSRKGGFIRVFPTPSTRRYMRFMEQPRYYNLLLDQWVTRYNKMEHRGIALLQELCEEGLHLENPTDKPRHQWGNPGSSMLMSARDKSTSPLKKENPPHQVKSR